MIVAYVLRLNSQENRQGRGLIMQPNKTPPTKRVLCDPLHGSTRSGGSTRRAFSYARLRQEIKQNIQRPVRPGKASRFIEHFAEISRHCRFVVVYLRESSRTRQKNRRMRDQRNWVLMKLRQAGVVILRVFPEVGPGWSGTEHLKERTKAALLAKRYGAVLVSESVDRLLRCIDFRHDDPNPAQPYECEFEELMAIMPGVRFTTLLHPDTDWRDVRKHQTKRGFGVKCEPGEKKLRRLALRDWVVKLRCGWGCTLNEISAETGLAKSTFRDWLP